MDFFDKWTTAVLKKESILCAGLDLPLPGMGRQDDILPMESERLEWSIRYIEAVAPYVCAIKPNMKYWLYDSCFSKILSFIREMGLLLILDSKIADIGSTNDAEYYSQSKHEVDAVTISPFAGNIHSTVTDCLKRNLGCFVMGLMSNPEYMTVKNSLIPLSSETTKHYKEEDKIYIQEQAFVKLYIYLTRESVHAGASGMVVGTTEHITVDEIKSIRKYANDRTLLLCPGIGFQGGNADIFEGIVNPKNIIVCISRGMMFPEGKKPTPESHRKKAKEYHQYFRSFLMKK